MKPELFQIQCSIVTNPDEIALPEMREATQKDFESADITYSYPFMAYRSITEASDAAARINKESPMFAVVVPAQPVDLLGKKFWRMTDDDRMGYAGADQFSLICYEEREDGSSITFIYSPWEKTLYVDEHKSEGELVYYQSWSLTNHDISSGHPDWKALNE